MKRSSRYLMPFGGSVAWIACVAVAFGGQCLLGQEAPATRPVVAEMPADAVPIEAVVIRVQGRAQWAPVGTEVTDAGAWKPVQLDDRYGSGTLIRTGLGSNVVLQFGQEEPYTVVMVERLTLASIAALYKTGTEKVSNVAVNYGAIRGGVSEGGLRSSFVVDSSVATLTKRGTWNFRIFVERGTGRFEISLADQGLVEALNHITRQRQTIQPGQYLTEAMIRWVDQTCFDRLILLQDTFGMTAEEFTFKAFHNTGLAVIDPASSYNIYQQARPGFEAFVGERIAMLQREQLGQLRQLERLRQIIDQILRPPSPPTDGVIRRPEGDFNARF